MQSHHQEDTVSRVSKIWEKILTITAAFFGQLTPTEPVLADTEVTEKKLFQMSLNEIKIPL